MTTLPIVYRVNSSIGLTHCIVHVIWILEVNCPPPTWWTTMLRVCFHFLCLYFTNISIVSTSYLFIAFLLFVALPLWPTGILPSVLIFLCCSCLCNLCLSSVCSCHVFIFYIVHTIYMSIFDRFLLFAALPLWPAVRQPSVLIFLYLIIYIFSVCSFL